MQSLVATSIITHVVAHNYTKYGRQVTVFNTAPSAPLLNHSFYGHHVSSASQVGVIHGFTLSTTVTDFDPIGSKQCNAMQPLITNNLA